MTDVAQSVLNLHSQMDSNGRESLKVLTTINRDASLAIEASKAVVLKLKNACQVVLPLLNQRNDQTQLNLAIKTYLDKTGLLSPAVATAVEKLTKVSAEAVKGIILILFLLWANIHFKTYKLYLQTIPTNLPKQLFYFLKNIRRLGTIYFKNP